MQTNESLQLLLIEDNPGDARYIEEMLREATELSVRVGETAETAAVADADRPAPALHHETRLDQGLAHLDDGSIDAVLLDLDLPDSNGLETLSTVLDHTDTPVVVLTGQRDREVGTTALREGAEEYLVKNEITGDLLVRSLFHAIERQENQRQLRRHEVLLEESTDVNAIFDPDGTFRYVTPSVESVLGYAPEEVTDEVAMAYVHPDDREGVKSAFRNLLENEREPAFEFRFEHADGGWVTLEGRGRNLRDDPLVEGVVVYARDVTERVERERRLARQRGHLAALNDLNAIVRDINEALIEQSTREEVEVLVVDRLAGSKSYSGAWIGDVDLESGDVEPRVSAGMGDYLEEIAVSVDDDPTGQGPTGRAIRTGEMQAVADIETDEAFERWRETALERGFRSSAAIPIGYQGTLYGVLNVYADRPTAFEGQERSVVGQLGDTIGHAINAIERKQVLQSEEVLEVEFAVQNYVEARGLDHVGGTITLRRAVTIGGGRYVFYGTVTESGLETLDGLRDSVDHWEELTVSGGDSDEYRFEVDLSQPPVVSTIAERGGRLHRAVIEDGTYTIVVHLPPGAEVREIAEAIEADLPEAQLIAQRRTKAGSGTVTSTFGDLDELLTTRQRNVLETAYYAGFFEWPREQTGEDVAETLEVSPPTFHQHLRAGERKLLESLFEEP